jgi:alkanesulfonate monooxygenase SsuD/methylene tetrahydromethanopterin reductase-like flavin-dependent oxidoreductase (luciferase family)
LTRPERQLLLVGFLQAQNCSNYPGSWRHRDAAADFLTPAYYQRIARTLEAGKFQMAFFDDRLAIPDRTATTSSRRCATASAQSSSTRSH